MAKKIQMEKAVYSVIEVAGIMGISIPSAYDLVKRPGFPCVRTSERRYVIPKEAFHTWLNNQTLTEQE